MKLLLIQLLLISSGSLEPTVNPTLLYTNISYLSKPLSASPFKAKPTDFSERYYLKLGAVSITLTAPDYTESITAFVIISSVSLSKYPL